MRDIISSGFYDLLEASSLVDSSVPDLIRLAAFSEIEFCVFVPSGYRAHIVFPSLILVRDGASATSRVLFPKPENIDDACPRRSDYTFGLILSPHQCNYLMAYRAIKQELFESGYSLLGQRTFGIVTPPIRELPLPSPTFGNNPDVSGRRGICAFALYPINVEFRQSHGTWLPEPQDLLIEIKDVRVLGSELLRLPYSEKTATDSYADEAKRAQLPVVNSEGLNLHPVENASSAGSSLPKPQAIEAREPSRSTQLNSISTVGSAEMSRGNCPLSKAPVKLLPRDEVERRINKGKSWIYDRLNTGHPSYDPTFPKSIRIGGSVGWIESEISSWLDAQITSNRSDPPGE